MKRPIYDSITKEAVEDFFSLAIELAKEGNCYDAAATYGKAVEKLEDSGLGKETIEKFTIPFPYIEELCRAAESGNNGYFEKRLKEIRSLAENGYPGYRRAFDALKHASETLDGPEFPEEILEEMDASFSIYQEMRAKGIHGFRKEEYPTE